MKFRGGFLKSVVATALILTGLTWAAGAGKSITVKGYVLDSACAFT
jgi:type 1 fimbria pilin